MSDVMSGSGLTTGVIDALWNAARLAEADMVAFTQRLIRTVSLPAEEGEIAKVVASEMQTLGYDKVWIDEIGSVIGFIGATGQESGRVRRSIMLNTHLDHVDVGDHARWPHPPYDAVVAEGHIWGRGSS